MKIEANSSKSDVHVKKESWQQKCCYSGEPPTIKDDIKLFVRLIWAKTCRAL